nr:hypothetical protein [Tanacetum cinerariifolium]
ITIPAIYLAQKMGILLFLDNGGSGGEPLSPDYVFDFPKDELKPHPAYDFFAFAPLPGYDGNPNNNNGWLEANDYLLGELEAMVNEQMVVHTIEEVAEPVVEAEEERVITPVVDMEERQMDVPMIDMEEDLAVLLDDDDFEDDAFDGFGEEEVEGPSTAIAEGPSFPHLALGLSVPPFVIEDLSTRLSNLDYRHGQLCRGLTRWEEVGALVEQGQQIAAQRDEMVVELTQQVQALQIDEQQRDTQIQQLQTIITEMGSKESILMRYILGLKRQIAALERRPPRPQYS